MLTIHVVGDELYDEDRNEFINGFEGDLELEHSLVALSKWESKWHIPYIGNEKLTEEQVLDYIKCMTLNDVDPVVYSHLSMDNTKRIREYIEDSMTATTFVESEGSSPARNVITSELVYYWMVALQIPFECQHWHLHRLLTLIRVCNVKNQPDKKMSTAATLRQNQALNAARRAKYKSRG